LLAGFSLEAKWLDSFCRRLRIDEETKINVAAAGALIGGVSRLGFMIFEFQRSSGRLILICGSLIMVLLRWLDGTIYSQFSCGGYLFRYRCWLQVPFNESLALSLSKTIILSVRKVISLFADDE
jgi:hypothetical protein